MYGELDAALALVEHYADYYIVVGIVVDIVDIAVGIAVGIVVGIVDIAAVVVLVVDGDAVVPTAPVVVGGRIGAYIVR